MIGAPLVVAALLLAASPARAATEGASGWEFFWQAVNLLILIGVLIYFGGGPIRDALARRRNAIQERLRDSARVLTEAEARLAEWKQRTSRLSAELEGIRETTRRLAEEERERILAQARAGAERIRAGARAAVDHELRRARAALRAEAASLAVELAGRLLRENVSEADHQRLFDEFVERIEGAGAEG